MRALLLTLLLSLPMALGGCAATVTGEEFGVWEQTLQSRGKLRTDRDPADAPFTNRDLLRHFDLIAFGLEPDFNEGRTRTERLGRWEEPIRWWVFKDASADPDAQTDVRMTFERIAAATGLGVGKAANAKVSNFDIWFLGPGDYDKAVAWATDVLGAEMADMFRTFRTSDIPCRARIFARSQPEDGLPTGSHTYALILIREGFTDDFRLGCVEEELAQAMGLVNDDDSVRPSVFNDDEEFAFLTTHDEWLLRLLYHPRLRAGMSYERSILIASDALEEMRPGR